eukprot:2295725-Pleurochrysis_carterae.AAC.2
MRPQKHADAVSGQRQQTQRRDNHRRGTPPKDKDALRHCRGMTMIHGACGKHLYKRLGKSVRNGTGRVLGRALLGG